MTDAAEAGVDSTLTTVVYCFRGVTERLVDDAQLAFWLRGVTCTCRLKRSTISCGWRWIIAACVDCPGQRCRVRWQEATITTLRSCVMIWLPLLLGRFVYAMQCLR